MVKTAHENDDMKSYLFALSNVIEGISSGENPIIFDIRPISRSCLDQALMIQEIAATKGFDVRILTIN